MALSDLFNGCYSGEHQRQSPEQFKATFCAVCENATCKNSRTGRTAWMARILTQEDRLLINPKFAGDGAGDGYPDFHDMVRQALAAEISSRKGDWSVPTDAEVRDAARELLTAPVGFQKPPEQWTVKGDSPGSEYDVTRTHDDKWACTCKAFAFKQDCKHIQDIKTKLANAPVESGPPGPPTSRPAPFLPPATNTQTPAGGIMVGGGSVSPGPETRDPWAVPERKIGVGGRITLGGGTNKT